jgi:hypothetical protein
MIDRRTVHIVVLSMVVCGFCRDASSQQPPRTTNNPVRSASDRPNSSTPRPIAIPVANDTDAVVVCPKAWHTELKPWLTHRREQGLQISVIDTVATREGLKQQIGNIAQANPQKLKYVLLIGDVATAEKAAVKDVSQTIPTFYVDSTAMARFGSEPHIASDNPFADLDNDGLPELAIGRVPCDTHLEVRSWVQRVIAYEQQQDFSEWRRRVHVVAGVGGFGVLIDSAVEMTAKQFLSQGIPGGYSLSLTQASPTSPYCPIPADFSDTSIARFNEGGLFWIYLGHGNIRHLDFIRDEDRWHCILDEECLPRIQPGTKSPIAVFLACYTGAFDAQHDSIAERLINQTDGPIAALAGSRMTGPYGMSVLGGEMLEICFEDRCETLGEIIRQAKCRSMQKVDLNQAKTLAPTNPKRKWIDQLATALSPTNHDLDRERFEHVQMMNLLGDPMLKISHPEVIDLQCEPEMQAGESMTIRGTAPFAGRLTIDIVYRRDRLPEAAKAAVQTTKPKANNSLPAEPTSKKEIYNLANQPIIIHCTLDVPAGDFETKLAIPSEAKGACAVRAFLESQSGWGLGSSELTIKAVKK